MGKEITNSEKKWNNLPEDYRFLTKMIVQSLTLEHSRYGKLHNHLQH